MHKIYYLSTCSTCIRIIKDLNITTDNFMMQDIKTEAITETQIEEMQQLSGSYEALFSRRAMKYKSMGLGSKTLQETDYKKLIQAEYTFLKRPVFIVNGEIFIGNSKKVVQLVNEALN